jgi:hypothetical protein
VVTAPDLEHVVPGFIVLADARDKEPDKRARTTENITPAFFIVKSLLV